VTEISEKLESDLLDISARYDIAMNKMCHLKFLKYGELYTQRKNIKTHIIIRVKVFHGERKTHLIKVSI
jgi:hypothetical protein